MRELYDPSVEQIVKSKKDKDEESGRIESVFLDGQEGKNDKDLLVYGP